MTARLTAHRREKILEIVREVIGSGKRRMIKPRGKRFTGFVFRVLMRARKPVPLVTVKDRVQKFYYVPVHGQDVVHATAELERQGLVTLDKSEGKFFSVIYAQPSALYRLASL